MKDYFVTITLFGSVDAETREEARTEVERQFPMETTYGVVRVGDVEIETGQGTPYDDKGNLVPIGA